MGKHTNYISDQQNWHKSNANLVMHKTRIALLDNWLIFQPHQHRQHQNPTVLVHDINIQHTSNLPGNNIINPQTSATKTDAHNTKHTNCG